MKANCKHSTVAGSSTSSLAISSRNTSVNEHNDGNRVKNSLPQRLNPKIKFKPSDPSAGHWTQKTPAGQKLASFTGALLVSASTRSVPNPPQNSTSPPKAGPSIVRKQSSVKVDFPVDEFAEVQRDTSSLPPGFRKVRICQLRLRKMAEIEVIYEGQGAADLNESRAAIRREREAAKAAYAAEKAKLQSSGVKVSAIGLDSTRKSKSKTLVKTTTIVQPSVLGQLKLDSWIKKNSAGGFVAPLDSTASVMLPPPVVAKPSYFIVTPQVDRTQKFRNYVNALQSHFATGNIVVKAGTKRIRFLKKNARKYEDSRLFSAALPRGAVLTPLPEAAKQQANDSLSSYSTPLDADKLFTLMSIVQFVWGIKLACKCSRSKNFDDVKSLCGDLPNFGKLCCFIGVQFCESYSILSPLKFCDKTDALYGFLSTVAPTPGFHRRSPVMLKPSTISVELGTLLRLVLFLLLADEEEQDKIFNHSTKSLLVSDEFLSFRFLRRLVKRQQGYEADAAAERYQKEIKDNEGDDFEDRSADDIDLSKWLDLESYIEQLEKDPNITLWSPDRILSLLHALLMLAAQSDKMSWMLEKLTEIISRKRSDLYMLMREMAPLKKQLLAATAGSNSAKTIKKADVATKARGDSVDAGEKVKHKDAAVAEAAGSPRRSVEPSTDGLPAKAAAPGTSETLPSASAIDERTLAVLNRKIAELAERHQRMERELNEAESAVDGLRGAVRFFGFDRNQSAYFTLLDGNGTVFVILNNFAAQQFLATSAPTPAAGSDIGTFMAFHAAQYGATRVHLNVVDEAHPDDLRELVCRAKNKSVYNVTIGSCAVDRAKPLPRIATLLEISNLCRNTLSSVVIKYSGQDEITAVHAALNCMGARESHLKRSLHEFVVEQWGEEALAAEVAAEQQTVDKVEGGEKSQDADEQADEKQPADNAAGTKKRVHRKADYKFSMFDAPDFSRPDNSINDAEEVNASVGRLDDVWTRIATLANNMYEKARNQFALFNDTSTTTSIVGGAVSKSALKAAKLKVKNLHFSKAAVWLVEPDVSAAELVDASVDASSIGFALIEALLEYADALRADYVTEFGKQCIRYIGTHREEILGNGEQSAWLHLYLIFKLFESEGIDIPDVMGMRTRLKRRNYDEASISSSGSSRASRQKLLESYDTLFDNIFSDTRMDDGTAAAEDTVVADADENGGEEEDFEAEAILRQASVDDVQNDADYRVDDSDEDFVGRKRRKGRDDSERSSRRSSRAGSSSGRSAGADPAALAAAKIARQQAEREARRNKRAAVASPPPSETAEMEEIVNPVKRARRARDESSSATSSSFSVESGQSGGSRRILRGFVLKKPALESVDEDDSEAAAENDGDAVTSSAVRRRLRSSNRPAVSLSSSSPSHQRAPGSSCSSTAGDHDDDRRPTAVSRANDSGSSAGKRNNGADDSDDGSIEELFQQPKKPAFPPAPSTSSRSRTFANGAESSANGVKKINAKKMFIRS